MHPTENLSFDEFWKFAAKINPAISENDADVFWQNYYLWDEFRFFPDIMKSRTHLPVALILDLESAYQFFLASKKSLELEDVIEATEWIKILRDVLVKVGAEKFVSLYHCHPEFIYQEIISRSEVESRINQKIENSGCLFEILCKI